MINKLSKRHSSEDIGTYINYTIKCPCCGTILNFRCEYEDDSHIKDFTVSADNPIDACYELILKLHELKML